MAHASQRLSIFRNRNPRSPGSYLLISKKTGFMDVWINGVHYYYNSMQEGDLSKVDVNQLAQEALPQQPKKTIVVVRRKQ